MRLRTKVKLDTRGLQRKLEQILDDYGPLISFQLQQELSKDQYDWPRNRSDGSEIVTYRKNGQQVTTPRDIVDTGNLLNSQTDPNITSGASYVRLQINWTAKYSKAVLEGNYIVGNLGEGRSYIAPGRDWITPALRLQPLLPYFVQRWKALDTQ